MRRVSRLTSVMVSLLVLFGVGRADDRNVLVLDGKVFGVRTQPLTTGLNISSFVFSPDGRQIAFIDFRAPGREEVMKAEALQQRFDPEVFRSLITIRLGVLTVASSRVQFLATAPDPTPGTPLRLIMPDGLAWSADSRFLVVQLDTMPEQPGQDSSQSALLVVEVATAKSWVSPAYASISSAAWHPQDRLLAFSARMVSEAQDEVYLWDPLGSAPVRLTAGDFPRWTPDGWLTLMHMEPPQPGQRNFDGPQPIDIHPVSGQTRRGQRNIDPSPLVLSRGRWSATSREVPERGYRIVQEGSGPDRGALAVERIGEPAPPRPKVVVYRPQPGERVEPYALSPDGSLVVLPVLRAQRQPHDGAFKLDVYDLWVFAPLAPARSNFSWVATFKPTETEVALFAVQWALDSRRFGFVADGNLVLATLEDWSKRQFVIVDGEAIYAFADRMTVMSNLRQIALAALMFAEEHDDRLPDASRFRDDIRPFLRNDSLYGRPRETGSDLFEWLALSGFALHDIPRPAQTPLGLVAWPPGEIQVAFVDGHVKTFTADAWAQFVQQARAEGWWPTGW